MASALSCLHPHAIELARRRSRTPRGACLTASDCLRVLLTGCKAAAPQMASANNRIVIDLRRARGAKLDAAAFESPAALLVRFVSLSVAQGCYGATVAALKQKDAVSCVLCDAKPLDDGHQRELETRACPNGSFGLVPRPRAKVPHVVVQPRSLEDASSPRGAPSQRPGDNSTRIGRTTARWHWKPAPKSRSSGPDASLRLLLPRDDAGRSRAARYSDAEGTCRRT